jgi:hypothetical protein
MRPQKRACSFTVVLSSITLISMPFLASGQTSRPSQRERMKTRSQQMEKAGLSIPFKGITTDGKVIKGLFPIRSTGVSTAPMRHSTSAFLRTLTAEQRKKTVFPVDDPEWRKWMNQHFYVRQGVGFDEMSQTQREAAFAMMRSALSAKGLKLSRDIMKLNHSLGEIKNNFTEYGQWLYWITVMGEPSADKPWGWQLDGHHLIINCFVLGDQVVMTPTFTGSEPVIAESGDFKGTAILQEQQDLGLAMIRALNKKQKELAIIQVSKTGNNNLTEAYRDNVVLDYAGIKAEDLRPTQKQQLLRLIGSYIHNMHPDHAKIKMKEVKQHLSNTHFAWIGRTDDKAVFYYRIHSPVLLIEFDHQRPVGMRQLIPGGKPSRQHIHTVVRTPNGNDYGKDLLRQHHHQHSHAHEHH